MRLAEAADALAQVLGTVRPTWVERWLANQDYDFCSRRCAAGFDSELRCAGWERESPQTEFRLFGLSPPDPQWQPLVQQAGWQFGASTPST
ncbi:hypothetical protein SAMN04488509_101458 [Aquimonas voraii]|uniref:Uncharacterized protein n=2 Tax=Aquimonas voraii TaxID=265719 RepID=A0A1G6SES7_9GAMM|nr:hypothetical protein SAMN04488509_101458 [Aquimonas voraii]